jgi:hypothetical protein
VPWVRGFFLSEQSTGDPITRNRSAEPPRLRAVPVVVVPLGSLYNEVVTFAVEASRSPGAEPARWPVEGDDVELPSASTYTEDPAFHKTPSTVAAS